MHILIVHQYFLSKKDGGGSRWNQFAKYWARAGHKITVLAGTVHYTTGKKQPEYKGKFVVHEQETENVEVLRCYVSESYNKNFIGRFWAYVSFVFSSAWAGLFHVGKCDVIICTSPPLTVGLTGWVLRRLKRIPLVFEVRDLWPETAIDTGVLTNKWLIKMAYWLEKLSYSSSNWINVLTPAFKKALVKKKNVRPDRISIIPNGADLDIVKPGNRNNWVRQKHQLDDKLVITYVGAHGVCNHLIQILEAAKLLRSQPDILFMLVGDGMQKPMLKQKAAEWGLDNVLFVDSVPKDVIGDYIIASDVCTAVLKKIDTFKTVYPNKVFDYMAAEKPIIIGIDGAARKLVEDAKAGMYVEPEDAKEFAEAVLKLRENRQLCKEYGENGLNFVRQNFDRGVLAGRYVDILTNKVVTAKKQRVVK
ncbi:MAG: glycosyltransferase family 4 protein [Planctomycetes bacterium]|nr:glycosyltransferase family 4 protein [Planctomycetota bacterium]